MSVGILLIAHGRLGSELLRVAISIFGVCPAPASAIEVENDAPCDQLLAEARRRAETLDAGGGVLVLTDLYGSPPANRAVALLEEGGEPRRRVLAGVNLPMLIRAFNYAGLSLDELVEKALTGGRDGVFPCNGGRPQD